MIWLRPTTAPLDDGLPMVDAPAEIAKPEPPPGFWRRVGRYVLRTLGTPR